MIDLVAVLVEAPCPGVLEHADVLGELVYTAPLTVLPIDHAFEIATHSPGVHILRL